MRILMNTKMVEAIPHVLKMFDTLHGFCKIEKLSDGDVTLHLGSKAKVVMSGLLNVRARGGFEYSLHY